MCPECGGEVEMQGASFCGPPGAYCGTCDGYDYPNYGYYPDETAREVARELEAWALCFLRGLPIQSDAAREIAAEMREHAQMVDEHGVDTTPNMLTRWAKRVTRIAEPDVPAVVWVKDDDDPYNNGQDRFSCLYLHQKRIAVLDDLASESIHKNAPQLFRDGPPSISVHGAPGKPGVTCSTCEEPSTVQYCDACLEVEVCSLCEHQTDCDSCEKRIEYEELHEQVYALLSVLGVGPVAKIEKLEEALEECHDALERMWLRLQRSHSWTARWPRYEEKWRKVFWRTWDRRTGTTQRNGRPWFGDVFFRDWHEMWDW
jgi:hypothetical protein